VCIENNKVIGIQNYEPNVPDTIHVVSISDAEYSQIISQTHRFDVESKTVVSVDSEILANKEQEKLNAVERDFLNSTDWKVLRHIRQKALGIPTSLTEAQYLELEQQRQSAAARIV
jgi:hypothetical protein